MKISFDDLMGREPKEGESFYTKEAKWYDAERTQKYCRAGVYCVLLNNKVVYIGESKDMQWRIHQHIKEISNDIPNEKKYKYLSDARNAGLNIRFDVLYYSPLDGVAAKADIKEREAYFINYYLPPLNKQIPRHKDFAKQLSLLPQVDSYQTAIELAKEKAQ